MGQELFLSGDPPQVRLATFGIRIGRELILSGDPPLSVLSNICNKDRPRTLFVLGSSLIALSVIPQRALNAQKTVGQKLIKHIGLVKKKMINADLQALMLKNGKTTHVGIQCFCPVRKLWMRKDSVGCCLQLLRFFGKQFQLNYFSKEVV